MHRKPIHEVLNELLRRFKYRGYVQVPNYNKFAYVGNTDSSITILREKGTTVSVPLSRIGKAIEAVRIDSTIYHNGPNSLRPYGITHINSPIWSLLHLLTIEEIRDI